MDISKLSRHTKQAKEKIFNALNISNSPKFNPKNKRISIDVSKDDKILKTINDILENWNKTINEKEIDTELVIQNICGENGAAKKLANSMLTKNKGSESGFKNLVSEQLKGITEENDLLQNDLTKIENSLKKYIISKRRGVSSIKYSKEGSEAKGGANSEESSEDKSEAAKIVKDGKSVKGSKSAREIDWLKLLCALIVLYVAETTITEKQIHDAIIKEVTKITKASTTFYELKSAFETISKIETILQRDSEKLSILRQLLEYIVECLNNTEFVSIPIDLFLKANESLFSSIDKSTSDVLIGFFNKAQELAREQSGDLSEEIETKKQIDGAQIDAANKFIKEKVTAITETSTTFYELKSKFETILQRDAKKLSILQPLLKDIGIRLNDTTFVPVSIEFLIATNKLTDDSIHKDTKTALSGFLKKAKELASKRSGDPSEVSQLMSDMDKEREKQLIEYLKDKIKIKKIRTVGNVKGMVKKKYVISQDGTELIIYPSLEYKDFLDAVKHLCKIGDDSIKDIDCLGEEHRFPESKSYNNIDERPVGLFKPDLLNAKTREILLLKWEDFLDKKLICVNSKDESKEYTYKQIIGMSEDERNQLFGELYKIEELRQEVKKKIKITDKHLLEELSKIAPEVTKFPRGKGMQKFAGVYLWAKGYQVERFLGGGGFGSAWECKSKYNPSEHIVVKVLISNDAPAALTFEEINSVKILNDILDKDSDGKAKRYLTGMNVIEETDEGSGSLIESKLAEGDLKAIFKRKKDEDSQKQTQTQTQEPLKLSGVLRKARQALKSVQVLHNAGYSHNDIKPANFLRVQDWSMKKEKEDTVKSINTILESEQIDAKKVAQIKNIEIKNKSLHQIEEITNSTKDDAQKIKEIREFINSKKLHKHSVQLSDFGTLTKISIVRGWGVWSDVYSSGYIGIDDYRIEKTPINGVQYADSELVAKRDVYALGVTLMNFLIDRIDDGAFDKVELLQCQTFNASDWEEIIKRYGEDSSENIQRYLQLIQKMVEQDYKARISLDDALKELKEIR